MTTLSARADHFVRWFFHSSPDPASIEPHETSGLDQPIVRKTVLAAAVVIAIILLLVFHSVVAGAVERGAQRRAEAEVLSLKAASRHVAQSPYFSTRRVSVAGTSD